MAKTHIFADLMEGVAAMKNHREGKLTLRSYKVEGVAAAQGGLQGHPGYSKEAALLARGLRQQTANQRTHPGEMGTGPREAEPTGRRAGSSSAPLSGYAGTAGRSCGWIGLPPVFEPLIVSVPGQLVLGVRTSSDVYPRRKV